MNRTCPLWPKMGWIFPKSARVQLLIVVKWWTLSVSFVDRVLHKFCSGAVVDRGVQLWEIIQNFMVSLWMANYAVFTVVLPAPAYTLCALYFFNFIMAAVLIFGLLIVSRTNFSLIVSLSIHPLLADRWSKPSLLLPYYPDCAPCRTCHVKDASFA